MTQNMDDHSLDSDFQAALAEDAKSSSPLTPAPEQAPNLFAGTLDDAVWAAKLNKQTDEMEKAHAAGKAPGIGVGWGMRSKEETQAYARQRKEDLKAPPSAFDIFMRLPGLPSILAGGAEGIADAMAGKTPEERAAGLAKPLGEMGARPYVAEAKDRKKEEDAIAAIMANPNAQVPGFVRSTAESTAQVLSTMPGAIVESVGIGAALAGWAYGGPNDKIQDNTVQAVGRWAQAYAKSLFPGDPMRQQDFSAKLAQGIGSTAGFWGVNSAAITTGLAKQGSAALVALTGALSQANQPYNDAKKQKDVSDAQLAMAYVGGLALGAAEAIPIIENMPGLSLQTKNKAIAFFSTIHREGLEEGMQELGQQLGQNLLAKYGAPEMTMRFGVPLPSGGWVPGYDPHQDIWEDVTPNALVGYLSGGLVTASRLARSPQAREQAIIEARGGHATPDTGRPAAVMPPPERGGQPAQPFTIDLDRYAGPMPEQQAAGAAAGYPAPQPVPELAPGAELAGSARFPDGSAASGARQTAVAPAGFVANPDMVPTFNDIRPFLPLDAEGYPDVEHLYKVSEELTGKRYWNQLNDQEKDAVAAALAGVAVAPDAAQQPNVSAAAPQQTQAQAQTGAAPAAAPAAGIKTTAAPAAAPAMPAAPRSQIGDKEAAAALARAREVTRDGMGNVNESVATGEPLAPAFDNLGDYDAALAGIEREKADLEASVAALEAQMSTEKRPAKRRALEAAVASTRRDIESLDREVSGIQGGRDALAAQHPDLFDPARAAAEQLYDAKAPAASWPTEAIRAGEQSGLVRIDAEGIPRRAARPETADTSADEGLTDTRKSEMLDLARLATGPVRPARFGESHADGDPQGIRTLVDRLNTIDTESLRLGFARFANLTRARNRAQVIARVVQGIMAHELAVQDEDYRLSNAARDLIDQTVEDALAARPVSETIETVATETATNAVVDEAIKATRYLDKDAVQILREQGEAGLRQMLHETPSGDLQQVVSGNNLRIVLSGLGNAAQVDAIVAAVQDRAGIKVPRTIVGIAQAMGKLQIIGVGDTKAGTPEFKQIVDAAKAASVRAPEKTVDEVIAEANGEKVDDGFDPYAISAIVKLKREGEAKLRAALETLHPGQILSLAMAQHLAPVHMGAKGAMIDQVVAAAKQRLADRMGNMSEITAAAVELSPEAKAKVEQSVRSVLEDPEWKGDFDHARQVADIWESQADTAERKARVAYARKLIEQAAEARPDRGPDQLEDYSGITIDGYAGTQEDGREIAFGSVKKKFLKDAKDFLTSTQKLLAAKGFSAHVQEKKGRGGKKTAKKLDAVSVNKGGPAVSGEVSLTMVDADGNGIYAQVGTMMGGVSIVARSATREDRFGVHSQNHWLPNSLTAAELSDRLEKIARPVTAFAPEAGPVFGVATDKLPGYGTDAFKQASRFDFAGETVIGYEAATQRLVDQAKAYAGENGVANERKLTVLLGPPGAGKSHIAKKIAVATRSAFSTADDAKFVIPEFKQTDGAAYVHEESTDIAKDVVKRLVKDGTNLIIEKLGSNSGSIADLVDKMAQYGYAVDVVTVTAERSILETRIAARAAKTGRDVPTHALDEALSGIAGTVAAMKANGAVGNVTEVDTSRGTPHITDGGLIHGQQADAFLAPKPAAADGGAGVGQPGVVSERGGPFDGGPGERDRGNGAAASDGSLTVTSNPGDVVERLIGAYGKPVSKAARRYATALFAIGTDGKLYHDLIRKLNKDKAVKKADLDAIAYLYAGAGASRTRALALAAIDAEFLSRSRSEADKAVIAGDRAIITREGEDNANDRRRAERDRRVQDGARALSEGILSGGVRPDGEGRDAAGRADGNGAGSQGDVRPDRPADAGAGAGEEGRAVPGDGGRGQERAGGGERGRDGGTYSDPAVVEAVEKAEAERVARRRVEAASRMPANVMTAAVSVVEDAKPQNELAEAGIKEGAYYLKGGKLHQNVNGEAVPQKASGKVLKRFRGLMDIRDIVNDLLSGVAKGGTDASADYLRQKLNASYDKFVAEFGPINKETISVQTRKIKGETREITTVRYPNFDGFRDDPDAFKVAAIEEFDSQTQTAKKRAIFSADIVGAYERPEIAGPADALAVSLNEAGRVDMHRIAGMLKVSEAEAAKALGDRVFKDPSGERYLPAELYLSGDVVTKLEQAREIAKTNPDYTRNVTALEAVQPAALTRVDIRTTFGAPWVPTEIYNEFIAKVIGIKGGAVKFEPVTSQWIWANANKPFINPASQAAYGTDRVRVTDLVMAALNDKPVRVFNEVRNPDGSKGSVLDPKATEDAAVKVKLIADTFAGDQNSSMPGWVYEDETRAQTVEAVYNSTFNRLVPTKYDGSHLTLPGLSKTRVLANGQTAEFDLRPHQKNVIWRVIQSGNVLMDHCVGAGKAQPLDAKILTPDGWRLMGELSVGDMVIGRDGRPTRVLGVFPQGEKDIYRVQFSDGSATECCDEHLWLTQTYAERNAASNARRLGKIWGCATAKVRSLAEIRATLRSPHLNAVNHSIPMVAAVSFNSAPVPLSPYLLGVMIGDGCTRHKGTVAFSTADDEIIDLVRQEIPHGCEIRHLSGYDYAIRHSGAVMFADGVSAGGRSMRIRVSTHPVIKPLMDIGLWGKMAHEKRVPDLYKINSSEVRLGVLRGLMDTDGTVSQRGTSVEFTTTSAGLADDVRFLVQSLGGTTTRREKQIVGHRTAITLAISMPPDVNPFRLQRKASRVVAKSKYAPRRYIETVSLVGRKPAQCIRVENPDHLYVTDDFIVTHNTYAMIASAMELKRLGHIQRPMFVVPNHMLEQFTRSFYAAYPNAKLLVAEKKHMEAKNRKAFAARIAADKWDGIIITHSAFGRLPMQNAAYEEFFKAQLDEIIEAWEAAKQASDSARDPTVKQIEKKKKTVEAKLDKLMNEDRKDAGVTFEETGVDYIILDEAHLFKNLDYQSRHTNVKGIGVKGSQRSTDLFLKIRHLEKSRPGRTALFATGTPMSRSMAEIYTMQRYLQNDLLREYNIDKFDAWAATFGRIITQTELAPNGRDFRDTTSFSKFVNVPELQALYSRIADSVTENDINLPRPKLKGGRPQMIESELSGPEEDAIQRVIAEIAALRGPAEKGKDNHLSLFTRGLQISTDMRLVDPMDEFNPNGKIARLVSKVSEIYKTGVKPALAQVVFLDMGVPTSKAKAKPGAKSVKAEDENKIDGIRAKLAEGETDEDGADEAANEAAQIEDMLSGKFNLYQDIKTRLVSEGIPEKEIAFVHDAKNDQQKALLFKSVREGKVRVLIGSTARMGVGTNVQRYLTAMHHVDAPWNPADVVQRDGRIVRQGNLNPEVSIFRYVTKRSFEAYRWQLLDRKAQFEAQFRAGARGLREAEDIDSPLPEASDLKAAATGDPRIMEFAELTKEVRELEAAKRGHERSALNAQQALATAKATIAQYTANLAKYEKDAALVQDLKGDNFVMRLDTATLQGDVTKRDKAGVAIRDAILSAMRYHWGKDAVDIDVGSISGFKATVKAWKGELGVVATFGVEGAAAYEALGGAVRVNAESDPVGIVQRYTNIVLGIKGLETNAKRVIAEKTEQIGRLEVQAKPTPFPRAVRLAAAKARLAELEAALKPRGPQGGPGVPTQTQDGEEAQIDASVASLASDLSGLSVDELSSLAGPEIEWALRRAKTATVKALAPKRVRDVLAGAVLYGRAAETRARGWPEVADRMQAKAAEWASGNRAEPSADGNWNGNHSAPFARPANDRLSGPFVGEREARYQEDMRLNDLRRSIAQELRDAEQERIAGLGVGADGEGGGVAEGQPQASAADQGRGQGNAVGERLADPAFRARAIDAFLSPELRREAIAARAAAQGWARSGYHASEGDISQIDAFRPGRAFGFHVSLEDSAGANARAGTPTTFLDKLLKWIGSGPQTSYGAPAVAPVKLRVTKSLRMPHVTALNYGHWHEPMAWIAGMKHPDFDGPESLKRFVAGWMLENGVSLERPLVGDHRFSRALAAELDRLGYDSVVYKDTAQGIGRDSLMLWDASRVRSAYDFFHKDASGAEGLTASDDYINQDLTARLKALKDEEGLSDDEVYGFDELAALTAWHASPHDFNKFSVKHIGSGLGQQAYGHGLYFGEAKGTGDAYFDQIVEKVGNDGVVHLYQVSINAEKDDLLHLDKPISQQSDKIKQALVDNDIVLPAALNDPSMTGSKAYAILEDDVGPQGAMRILAEAGIPGLMYADAGSRAGVYGGTSNFVIVDESVISITHKDGKPVSNADREDILSSLKSDQDKYDAALARQQARRTMRNAAIRGGRMLADQIKKLEFARYRDDVTADERQAGYVSAYRVVFDDVYGQTVTLREISMPEPSDLPSTQIARSNALFDADTGRVISRGKDGLFFSDELRAIAEEVAAERVGLDGSEPASDVTGNKRLTPAAQAQYGDIVRDIEARLRQMMPGDVGLRFADRLFSATGHEQYGRFRPLSRMVELALAYGPEVAFSHGAHEIVHVLREANAFTDAEWGSLVERATKLDIPGEMAAAGLTTAYQREAQAQARRMGLPDDLSGEFVARRMEEEAVARLAQKHFAEPKSRFGAKVDALLQRMADILSAIAKAFNGRGFTTAGQVFRRMETGQIAKRVTPRRAPPALVAANDQRDIDALEVGRMWSSLIERNGEFLVGKKRPQPRRLTVGYGRYTRAQVIAQIAYREAMLRAMEANEYPYNERDTDSLALWHARVEEELTLFKATLERFNVEKLPRGKPFSPGKIIPAADGMVVRMATDDRHGSDEDSRVFRIFSKEQAAKLGDTPAARALRAALGYVEMTRHPDGRWEVGMVEVREKARGKGVAKALYAAVEKELGIEMHPSGILLPDGYAMWSRRNPDLVKWHREVPFGSYYLSPKRVDRDLNTYRASSDFYARRIVEFEQDIAKHKSDLADGTTPAEARAYAEGQIQFIERQIDGMKLSLRYNKEKIDALEKMWSDLPAEAKTPEALGQMFSIEHIEERTVRAAEAALSRGLDYYAPVENVRTVFANLPETFRAAVPPGVRVAVIDSVRALNWKKRHVTAIARTEDGSEISLNLSWDFLKRTRASFVAGNRNVILLGQLHALGDDVGHTLGGEAWHELVHAKRTVGILSGDDWAALLAHAQSLKHMDMPFRSYSRLLGRSDWQQAPESISIRRCYDFMYEGRIDRQELIDQETITHMLDLARAGYFPASAMAPVREIVERHFPGALPAAESAADPAAVSTRTFKIDGFDGRVETRMTETGFRARRYIAEQDGAPKLQATVIERDPNLWQAVGLRLSPDMQGKGMASALIDAIAADIGAPLADDGILTAEAYQRVAESDPDRVRFHVRGPKSLDGVFLSPQAIEAIGQATRDAIKAGLGEDELGDATRLLADVKALEGSVPDAYFATERMLAALAPNAAARAASDTASDFDLLRRAVAIHMRLHNQQVGKGGPTSSEITNHALHLVPILGIGVAHQAIMQPMMQGDPVAMTMTAVGGPLALSALHIREAARIFTRLKAQEARAARERALADGDTIEQPMAALRPTPLHLPKLGDLSKSDVKAVETGLSDLVTMVNDALGSEVRIGRLNPGMKAAMGRLGAKLYGHFNRATGITRMAIPNDLPTLAHEGGHSLEIHPDLGSHVEGIKQTFAHELVPLSTPGPNALSEGWAEWFRLYVVDPAEARNQAPGTTVAFRNMLEAQNPELLQALDAIQAAYQTLQTSSPAGVLLSRTKSAVKPDGFLAEKRQDVQDKGWRGAISDWIYAGIRDLTDAKHPLKKATDFLLQEAARNLSGANKLTGNERFILKAINDPYKNARMMEHARIHATAVLQNGVRFKGKDMPQGPSFRDALVAAFGGENRKLWNDEKAQKFGAYLIARRMNAEWDRYDVGSLESPPDHLMTRDAWGRAQTDIETAHPEFKKAGRILDLFMRNTLRWKYENGFLTKELYDDLRLRDGYAPLNRIMDKDGPSSLKAKGQNKRNLVMKFKGSTRDFINPIESIVADVYATQARIELNDTIRALDKSARAAGPNGGRIAERIPAKDLKGLDVTKVTESLRKLAEEQIKKAVASGAILQWDANAMMQDIDLAFDQDASKVLFKAVDTNERGERIVYLWEDGERVPIRLGSDQLGEDIWNIFAAVGNPSDMGAGLEAAVYFTQFFRAGVTKHPVYIVINWFRDQLSTWGLSRDFTPFWTGLRGMRDVIKNSDAVKRYNAFGGMGGGVDAHLIDTMGRQGDAMQLRENGFFAAPTRWQKFLRTMEVSELASRVAHMEAAYQRLLADGLSEEEAAFEAAYIAHDVMDFSKRGSRMMQMARLVAFLNAQVQGLSAALRTASGGRDDVINVRDAISPYLKAADGAPLSIAEKEALPNSYRILMKLFAIGLIGLALKWINWDDPEHEELSRGDMGFTHWFFKINGHWWRAPKPFELAIFSNLFEAMFDRLAKQDPTYVTRFLKSIRETVLLNPEMQTANVITTLYHGATGLLDSVTGKSQYDKGKDDVPQRLKGLPPEMQWDAYTSELSKLMAATFGMSPYKTDNVIRSLMATVGKDILTASDWVLPRLNMALGGALPGVMKEPRADKSMEDYMFLSRIMRRSGRGAYSTYQFWQEMSQDNGRYTEAYKGYHTLLDIQKSQRDAQAMLMGLDPDRRAYAVLMEHYKEQDKDLHPMHRAEQAIGAMNGIRRQMAEGHLFRDATMKKGKEAERIVVAPSTQRVVNEILEDMAMREARNAQVVLGKPGWANAGEMRTEGLWNELRAASPDVAAELEYRLTHGKHKVYNYDAVKAAWPAVKQHLLTEDPGTSLAGFRADAKGGGAPVPQAAPDGVRPPGMMRLGGPKPFVDPPPGAYDSGEHDDFGAGKTARMKDIMAAPDDYVIRRNYNRTLSDVTGPGGERWTLDEFTNAWENVDDPSAYKTKEDFAQAIRSGLVRKGGASYLGH